MHISFITDCLGGAIFKNRPLRHSIIVILDPKTINKAKLRFDYIASSAGK
jgi:hypothetical protein